MIVYWNLGLSKFGVEEGFLGRFLDGVLMSIKVEIFKSNVVGILGFFF